MLESQLVSAKTELADLTSEKALLESQLVSAKAELAKYYVGNVACTGSMRPVIECGDSGVFKTAFTISDIKIGTIVSYYPRANCRTNVYLSYLVLHRVNEIRYTGDATEYRLKGDANLSSDLCWVRFDKIESLLAYINKGGCPQCVVTTDAYYAAIDRVDALSRQYDELLALYDSQLVVYNRATNEYNSQKEIYEHMKSDSNYYLMAGAYNRAVVEYNVIEGLRLEIDRIVSQIKSTNEEVSTLQCRDIKVCD